MQGTSRISSVVLFIYALVAVGYLCESAVAQPHPSASCEDLPTDQNLPTEEEYLKTREIWTKKLGKNHPSLAFLENDLAEFCKSRNDFECAKQHYGKAREILVRTVGAFHPRLARTLDDLGYIHYIRGDYANAELVLESARRIKQKFGS